MRHLIQKTTFALTLVLLSVATLPYISQAGAMDVLIGKGKKCNYIKNGLYMPFSDIDSKFPLFGKLVQGGCVDVSVGVNNMFQTGFVVFLSVISLIAIVQISVGGIRWMLAGGNEGAVSKAKKLVTDSIIGLILALAAWLILFTVNQRLVQTNFDLSNGRIAELVQGSPNAYDNIAVVGDCVAGAPCDGAAAGPQGGTVGGWSGTKVAPSKFTNQSWSDYARAQIISSGLADLNPSDAEKFFPGGVPTADGYLRLMEEVIARESNFRPGTTYPEPGLGYNSVGLFQLSAKDFNYKYTEQQLKDPYLNMQLGISRFKTLVQMGNCIACGDTRDAKESGAAAYWSVLNTPEGHDNGKQDEIINALHTQP